MKRILSLLLLAALGLSLSGCGGKGVEANAGAASPAPAPAYTPAVTPTFDVAPAAGGQVRFLCPDTAAVALWQELGERYAALTGVPVTVEAAEADYESALAAALASPDAPTLYSCSAASAQEAVDGALDLRDSLVYGELTAPDCVLLDSAGRVVAVPWALECRGILVNTALLAEAGYELDYLNSFSHLRIASNDIHARSAKLGFDAFAPMPLSDGMERYTEDLAGVYVYMELRDAKRGGLEGAVSAKYVEDFHDMWDMLSTDAALSRGALLGCTAEQSLELFTGGQAVFALLGSGDEAALQGSALSPEQLHLLPLYGSLELEAEAGLSRRGSGYWSVNGRADEADIAATLDFLAWVVTSEEGLAALHERYDYLPYRSAPAPEGLFAQQGLAMVDAGCHWLPPLFTCIPHDGHAALAPLLQRYTNDPSYYNWYGLALGEVRKDWANCRLAY